MRKQERAFTDIDNGIFQVLYSRTRRLTRSSFCRRRKMAVLYRCCSGRSILVYCRTTAGGGCAVGSEAAANTGSNLDGGGECEHS